MLVTAVEARPLRSLDNVRVELCPGIISLVGPNGAGKTNFVEALYFGLTGRSFRTADRRELIPFGALACPRRGCRSRRGRDRAPPARLGEQGGGPSPPARRQRRRPGDDRPQPPAGRGLLPRSPGPDQGATCRAPRPPRRLCSGTLAVSLGAAQALRPGAGAAQRPAGPVDGRARAPGAN